jgi:hypothetical protein
MTMDRPTFRAELDRILPQHSPEERDQIAGLTEEIIDALEECSPEELDALVEAVEAALPASPPRRTEGEGAGGERPESSEVEQAPESGEA